jgi:hypothetical protein
MCHCVGHNARRTIGPHHFARSSRCKDPGAEKPAKTSKQKDKAKAAGKVRFDKGSGETTRERDRRLQRECKGRPNAGACLGYAS